MTAFAYILAALVGCLSIAQIGFEHYLNGLPENHSRKKRKGRLYLLWVVLGLFAANQIVSFIDAARLAENANRAAEKAEQDRKGSDAKISSLETKVNTLTTNLDIGVVQVKEEQKRLMGEFQSIALALANNPTLDPAVSTRILQASNRLYAVNTNIFDLDALTFRLRKDRAIAKIQNVQAIQEPWDKSREGFELTLKSVRAALVEFGKGCGETVYYDFASLPRDAPKENVLLAVMELGSNAPCRFEATLQMPGPYNQLLISSKCAGSNSITSLTIRGQGSPLPVFIDIYSIGQEHVFKIVDTQNYRKLVDDMAALFIAAHAEQCPKAKSQNQTKP